MSTNEFGPLKRKFFPVHNHELKKILPLNVLFFLVSATYGMLRAMKDAYVLPYKGADFIAFVKIFVCIPAMLLFKFIYDALSKRTGVNGRLYALLGYFFTFFLLFYFVFEGYVAADMRGKEIDINLLNEMSYLELGGKLWPYVLFYVHAESWGTMILSVSCWGFVNRITSSEQASRCYSTLSIGMGFATILAGAITLNFYDKPDFLIAIAMTFILGTALVYSLFTRSIAKDPVAYQIPAEKIKKKKKRLGAWKAMKAFFASERFFYLSLIFMLVFCCAMGIALFEGAYRTKLKARGEFLAQKGDYGSSAEYIRVMAGWQLIYIGILSLAFALFLAASIRGQGWRFAALFLPVVFCIGAMSYCVIVRFEENICNFWGCDRQQMLKWVVYLGLSVVVLAKSAKYVLFDTTKESTYIPLDSDTKTTGKSAIDGLGSRLGKAGGSFVIMLTKSISDLISPILLLSSGVVLVSIVWILAVVRLSREYGKLEKEVTTKGLEKIQ